MDIHNELRQQPDPESRCLLSLISSNQDRRMRLLSVFGISESQLRVAKGCYCELVPGIFPMAMQKRTNYSLLRSAPCMRTAVSQKLYLLLSKYNNPAMKKRNMEGCCNCIPADTARPHHSCLHFNQLSLFAYHLYCPGLLFIMYHGHLNCVIGIV